MSEIPKPHYSLINTSIGGDPAIVVVNSAMRGYGERERFPWHLQIAIGCEEQLERGMPTETENKILYQLEDDISALLSESDNAVFLARITARGERKLLYRVQDPEIANSILQREVGKEPPIREWDFEMSEDPHWELAEPELKLLERIPGMN